MKKQKIANGILEAIESPAMKFISQPLTEEKQIIDGQEVTQIKLNTEPQIGTKQPAKATEQKKKKRPAESLKTARINAMVTEEAKKKLERLAMVKRISVSELIVRFIDDGLKREKADLQKWEQIKEFLNYDN